MLRTSEARHSAHRRSPPARRQFEPAHTFTHNFSKISFNTNSYFAPTGLLQTFYQFRLRCHFQFNHINSKCPNSEAFFKTGITFCFSNEQNYVLGAFTKLRKATISFVMSARLFICRSVRPSIRQSVCLSAWNNPAPTGRILMKFEI
jgi:hypothetical protein